MGESKPNEESVSTQESSPTRWISSPTRWIIIAALLGVLLTQVVYGVLVFALVGPEMATRGQFGDIFGGLNALFTGLAFAGVIYTIILQRKELEMQREELQSSTKELRRAAEAQTEQARLQVRQAELRETSTRLTVIATLVDNYTSRIAVREQGRFRGYLWQANEKLISWTKEDIDKPLGDEEARNIDMQMVDQYFDKHSEVLASDNDNESSRLGDPVFRRAFKAWLRNRQQRDDLLEELETVYGELEQQANTPEGATMPDGSKHL